MLLPSGELRALRSGPAASPGIYRFMVAGQETDFTPSAELREHLPPSAVLCHLFP